MTTKNVGDTVNFKDNSTDASITSRAWDFGDGTTGAGQQTTHVYTVAGTYTVKLTLSNSNGSTVCTTQQISIVVPCVPNWACETPLNGYEADGCGHRQLNSACNPPCDPVWRCEKDADGNNTGNKLDGCGNVKYDVLMCPLCVPLWQCELPLNGYEQDGCSHRRKNSACNPCTPAWVCEQPLNGYEKDGCGNRQLNAACNPCVPNWQCEQPLNGYKKDGCGNKELDSACNPPPGSMGVNITAEPNPITEAQTSVVTIQVLDSDGAGIGGATIKLSVNGGSLCTDKGITDIGGIFKCKFTPPKTTQNETFTVSVIASKSGYTDGNGSVNIQVNDVVECVSKWACETPLNGYEADGCGNRRLNSACNPTTAPTDYTFIIAIVVVAAIMIFINKK